MDGAGRIRRSPLRCGEFRQLPTAHPFLARSARDLGIARGPGKGTKLQFLSAKMQSGFGLDGGDDGNPARWGDEQWGGASLRRSGNRRPSSLKAGGAAETRFTDRRLAVGEGIWLTPD